MQQQQQQQQHMMQQQLLQQQQMQQQMQQNVFTQRSVLPPKQDPQSPNLSARTVQSNHVILARTSFGWQH